MCLSCINGAPDCIRIYFSGQTVTSLKSLTTILDPGFGRQELMVPQALRVAALRESAFTMTKNAMTDLGIRSPLQRPTRTKRTALLRLSICCAIRPVDIALYGRTICRICTLRYAALAITVATTDYWLLYRSTPIIAPEAAGVMARVPSLRP